jgi:hypothetical protein
MQGSKDGHIVSNGESNFARSRMNCVFREYPDSGRCYRRGRREVGLGLRRDGGQDSPLVEGRLRISLFHQGSKLGSLPVTRIYLCLVRMKESTMAFSSCFIGRSVPPGRNRSAQYRKTTRPRTKPLHVVPAGNLCEHLIAWGFHAQAMGHRILLAGRQCFPTSTY